MNRQSRKIDYAEELECLPKHQGLINRKQMESMKTSVAISANRQCG